MDVLSLQQTLLVLHLQRAASSSFNTSYPSSFTFHSSSHPAPSLSLSLSLLVFHPLSHFLNLFLPLADFPPFLLLIPIAPLQLPLLYFCLVLLSLSPPTPISSLPSVSVNSGYKQLAQAEKMERKTGGKRGWRLRDQKGCRRW